MSHAIIVTNRRASDISAARLILDNGCQLSTVVAAECRSAFKLFFRSWDTSRPDNAIQFIDAVPSAMSRLHLAMAWIDSPSRPVFAAADIRASKTATHSPSQILSPSLRLSGLIVRCHPSSQHGRTTRNSTPPDPDPLSRNRSVKPRSHPGGVPFQ